MIKLDTNYMSGYDFKNSSSFKEIVIKLPNSLITGIILIFFCLAFSVSAQINLKIVDQKGSPLPNAVVAVILENDSKNVLVSQSRESNDAQSTYVMDQVNKAFLPEVLVIPMGSYVSFPNSDDIRHHVYSFSQTKPFELKLYAGKPERPVFFEQEGVVVLGCNIHDAMVGYIYVADTVNVVKSTANGEVNLPSSSVSSFTVWHPQAIAGVEHRKQYFLRDLAIIDGKATVVVDVNAPPLRDSFEDQFSNVQ